MAFDDPFQVNADAAAMDGNTNNNFYHFTDGDPAAEFLEREQRELGDIRGEGDGRSFVDCTIHASSLGSQSSLNQSGRSISPNPSPSGYQALSQLDEQQNEPEKIRKWRDEFAARITKKDQDEEVKRKEMREQAKKELEDFSKQRQEQMERRKEENRLNNRTLEEELMKNAVSSSNGKVHDWEKITSLCEFNPKNNRSQKDLTRYRSVLLQLKQQQQQTNANK